MMKTVILVLLVAAVYGKHEKYAGWKSFLVNPANQEQAETLSGKVIDLELDFLSPAVVGREAVVLVKPKYQADFLSFLLQENINYQVHAEDVKAQLDIDDHLIEARKSVTRANNGERITYDNYQPLEVIYEYLDKVAEEYSDVVTLVNPGNSFEGRPLKYLKISKDNFQSNKPVIFIDGGIHAREWISPPAVTYAIHKLVENVTDSELLERFDWILFPVVNPDGYVHTFTSDRFWSKTRSTDQHPLSKICPGVDGNSNYDFYWNEVGTSSSPCSDIYAGGKAFSEVEVRAVDEIIQANNNMILYITIHSYGSLILYPWGHDGTLSNNAFVLHTVGTTMASAIDELSLPHFPRYIVGNTALTLNYNVSGGSVDYAHYKGIPFTYTYELPGLDGGFQGFHLNPRYIIQVVAETWAGISAGAKRAASFFGTFNKH
ncbi:unnamed protein product, partial [Brenthis ino]